MTQEEQLAALARLDELLKERRISYWLFGGWAVDFHIGSVTRPHDDLDVAVWVKDRARIAEVLEAEGWEHTPDEAEDGYTSFARRRVRLEVAFLADDPGGEIYTPLLEGRASWPAGAFESCSAELLGVRASVISLAALIIEKSQDRDDPRVAEKDRIDREALIRRTQVRADP